MKATKSHIQNLESVLYRMKNAKAYIEKDNILICRKGDNTSFAYVNKNGEKIGTLTKFVGSDLNQLNNAISELERIIQNV